MNLKTREQRIFEAEAKIAGIKLVIEPLEKLIAAYESELRQAQNQFNIGDKVHTEETCDRGCCVEWESTATIVRVLDNDKEYVLKDVVDGREFNRYRWKMVRLDENGKQQKA